VERRRLGRSGIEVSAVGLGCWAIGGPWRDAEGWPAGWGEMADDASVRAVERALELGIDFFDTADVYGCGRSERVLGEALRGRRHRAVVATKFGLTFDEGTGRMTGADDDPAYVRRACEASLRRLQTDHIDVYLFHHGHCEVGAAAAVRDALEELVAAGKIRGYGWSTDDPARARAFAAGAHCTVVEHTLNYVRDDEGMLPVCAEHDLGSIAKMPFLKGLLTGKYTRGSRFPEDDNRFGMPLDQGLFAAALDATESLREALTADGRTPAQAALGWIWARSPVTVPIPGFKSVEQVEEHAAARRFGPLDDRAMALVRRTVEPLLAAVPPPPE
jgi:aryl-alcohol dehydrogenase-like predicted oxidoreductase